MIVLTSTDTIGFNASPASGFTFDVVVHYSDINSTGFTPDSFVTSISSSGSGFLGGPAAGTTRHIKTMTFVNLATVPVAVSLTYNAGGGAKNLTAAFPIGVGEVLCYEDGEGFYVLGTTGARKTVGDAPASTQTLNSSFLKTGTAPEAAGNIYSFAKDAGFPGAWAPGTPGVAGRATDGTTATDAGCIPIRAGSLTPYITNIGVQASQPCYFQLWDVMWVNSGLVVTTTTAQTVNSVALPARDVNGTTNGEGVFAGILVTTATTNAAAIANITLSYTNSAGTAGRTATMPAFPATATIGTIVPFLLQAGDTGVRSIQSITIGTSLVTGTISLIMYNPVTVHAVPAANTPMSPRKIEGNGIKLISTACLLPNIIAANATAPNLFGDIEFTLR